jgi:methylglutaconyl-CoA hydratase
MGARAAHRYFLTAERFDAAEALRIGFVHAVVPVERLDEQVAEITKALVNASPNAVKECKTLLHDVAGKDIDAALIAHTVQGIRHPRQAEGKEGVQSFLQKRKPAGLKGMSMHQNRARRRSYRAPWTARLSRLSATETKLGDQCLKKS